MHKILFVTGTDTGVGKTLVTASLVHHLRQRGVRALGMKPFCSGSRDDVRLIQAMQKGEISDDLVNPFYFRPPVAPLVAARKSRKKVRIDDILDRISHVRERTEWLIVEGAGGLLSPLGEDFSALDLISAIKSQVCVVAPNKLGVINHVRLTLAALESRGGALTKVLLTDRGLSADASRATNLALLAELLPGTPILRLPWLGPRASTANRIERNRARTRTLMEQVLS